MKIRLLASMLLVTFLSCPAYEWLYPVAFISQHNQTRLFVIHQKSIDHSELWLWDPQTHIASKALLSSYIPAALQIIPNHTGFSFIDAGRIRIKDFSKRSPKAIDIYEPIYDINKLSWLNEHVGYVAARQIDLLELFMVCNHGQLQLIAHDPGADCMYPQIINNSLWYIKRTSTHDDHHYSIVQTDCTPFICPYELSEDERLEFVRTHSNKKPPISQNISVLSNWGTKPIAFLYMISPEEGFFIQHPAVIDKHEPLLPCSYYRIWLHESVWHIDRLFNFTLPAYLLFDKQLRLYESMLPLLPRHSNDTIYYLHTDSEQQPIQLYSYQLTTHSIKQLSTNHAINQSCIAPLIVNNMVYYGGPLDDQLEHQVAMWIEDENVCFKLPSLPIS